MLISYEYTNLVETTVIHQHTGLLKAINMTAEKIITDKLIRRTVLNNLLQIYEKELDIDCYYVAVRNDRRRDR